MKDWYLLRGVEYSTNFDFFLENQIFLGSKVKMKVDFNLSEFEKKGYDIEKNMVFNRLKGKKEIGSRTVDVREVHSRLESCNFGEVYSSSEEKQTERLREIHNQLLSGKFGDGKFID